MSSEKAITDLPSGEPVPSSAPAPAPKPKPMPLGAVLAAAPSNIDAFLAHLQRCLSTPSGIDTLLMFVCYTTRLSSSALTTLVQPALHRSAERLIALASSLPPSATLLFSAKDLPSNTVTFVLELARRLKAISGLTSEARTITRLWGLLSMYFWARRLAFKAKQTDLEGSSAAEKKETVFETTLAWSQLAGCVAFQALENGAYLSSRGILGWKPATQAKAALWAARFWGSFVFLEFLRLYHESSKRSARTTDEKFAGGKTMDVFRREEAEWKQTWRKNLVRYLAWAPLTVHWGLEQGFIPDMAVGAIACVPSMIQMRDLWRSTAA